MFVPPKAVARTLHFSHNPFVTKAADKPQSFSVGERDIRRENLRRFPLSLSVPRRLPTKSEFSSSAITVDVHLLDPDVDRKYGRVQKSVAWSGLGF